GSAAGASATVIAPSFLLRYRIPCDKRAALSFSRNGSDRRRRWTFVLLRRCWLRSRACATIAANDSDVAIARLVDEVRVHRECAVAARRCRNVNQTRIRIERHGRPVMRTAGTGRERDGCLILIVVRVRIDDGP